jgi:thiol-disulfide isomerase/thioredoxin
MVKNLLFISLFLVITYSLIAQRAELIKLPALQKLISQKEKKITIVNFWATWCGPCVAEIPFFEKLNQERSDVKIILISMDMDLDPDPLKVWNFITRKKIQSKVYILDEHNPNEWIDRISKDWSGALPATLIVNSTTGERRFVEHELHDGDLETLIAEIK